ncbi:MAG: hypothetical protein KF773_42765 [Deltaproteobacteria bacterium]|nr:hypothetical protein [Deltaproteobacteria bacterium]MCW5806599.1 hypothetical protein [Deltaproteobacteria bacterium]
MYRYGDGTPFPLDENFIETLTMAVETCTNAFVPVTELDARRERAREARREGDREAGRLDDLERSLSSALSPYLPTDAKKPGATMQVATKLAQTAKQVIAEAKRQVDARVHQTEVQAAPSTASDAVLQALAPFFNGHQLPKSAWIMSWDVRGAEPSANAVATAGRLTAAFSLAPDPYRAPIRVEQLAEGVVVHMMKKGVFGKSKPAPIDLGKYVVVAFERSIGEHTITLKENPNKASAGLRFAVTETGATWTSITIAGDADGEANPLDVEDVAPIRKLVERASATLKDLINRRSLVDLSIAGKPLSDLDEPRIAPLELLNQLTPLARSIRERSKMSGELILKRDIGDGRREELFVPRSTLAQQFARLPPEYRRPFEDMGITAEETQPAIQLPRSPAPPRRTPPPEEPTIEVKEEP